jgi:hypothetical protein
MRCDILWRVYSQWRQLHFEHKAACFVGKLGGIEQGAFLTLQVELFLDVEFVF